MKIILIVIFAILLFGCSNKNNNVTGIESTSPNYVQGEVVAALIDSVTLDEFADYIYSLKDISINDIVFYNYYSTFPRDSLQIINSTFKLKAYISEGETITTYLDSLSEIRIKFWIKNFNSNDIRDWKTLKERFQLVHIPDPSQLSLLNVTPGKEKEWLNILSNSKLIKNVSLVGITHTM